MLEDGDQLVAKWQVPKGAFVKRIFDETMQSHVAEFNSKGTSGVSLRLKPGMELVFSMDLLFLEKNGSSLIINVEDRDQSKVFPIIFTCTSTLIAVEDLNTTYGLGPCETWIRLTRDLFIDLLKGNIQSGR